MPVVMNDLLGHGLAATAQSAHDQTEDQDEQTEPKKRVEEDGEQGNEHTPVGKLWGLFPSRASC
jgi:hypothetical protein